MAEKLSVEDDVDVKFEKQYKAHSISMDKLLYSQ